MQLRDFFNINNKVALGLSGGVDSAYLLYAGIESGADIRPYFIKTAFQPTFELNDAKRLASFLGVELSIIEMDILSDCKVSENSKARCYNCKRKMFTALRERALEDGYTIIIDGTNASDKTEDRPGMKAINELLVLSPLRECGLTKPEIRELSREAGLFTWNKPEYACLATRVPNGNQITEDLLLKIENSENALYKLGFRDCRIRIFHDAARIQLQESQLKLAIELKKDIIKNLKPYFETILLDLNGRE